ncbi:MAG: VCBS domain-containing protein, partial [Methylobacteriaceae bacterium]|nr:VCBS domain-containing protein [Methylobacteriaceae bacterium]
MHGWKMHKGWHCKATLAHNDRFVLGEDSVGDRTFDLLANDRGGKAKQLLAVADLGDFKNIRYTLADGGKGFVSARTGAEVSIGADGKLHYDATVPGAMNFDSLAAGEKIVETFVYAMRAGSGHLSFATAKIVIVGKNDAPVADAAVAEARSGGPAVTGAVHAHDVDRGAKLAFALAEPAPAGLVFNADGSWSFTATGPARDVVARYVVTDQHGAKSTSTLTIHVTGEGQVNAAPVAVAAQGAATEDGALAQGALSASDPDAGAVLTYALVGPTPAGLTLGADGTWSFDPSAAAYQHLAAGATQDVVATWRVTDEHGASADSTLTLRVAGVNDAAVIGGQDAGVAIEDGALTVAGRLTVADADDGEAGFQPATIQTTLGALTLGADGAWTYVADAARANAMAEGDTALDEIVVRSLDGTAHTLSITIRGANDAPVAVTAQGAATEDGATAQGAVSATDQDPGAALTYGLVGEAPAGLTMAADGTWSFDPSAAAYQHLAAGATQDVVAAWRVTDEHGAAADSTLTLRVTGVNDAAIIGGADAGEVIENGVAVATGRLTVADADDGEAAFRAEVVQTTYGALTIGADGVWSYALDAARAAPLHGGESALDAVVVRSIDGTEHTINLTVRGANAGPVAVAAQAAATEDGQLARGAVTATDPDPNATLTYGLVGAAPAGLTMAADGGWTFDASAPDYQHLAAGATQDVVATWRVTDEHGASADSTLTIRVTGVNDAAVIGGADAGEVIEDSALSVAGRLTVADADAGEAGFQPANVQTALGALTLAADGAGSYVADAARANAMAEGDTALDEIVVRSLDGTAHTLSITIRGANDAPVAVAANGAATEDGAIAQGAVSATDPDPGANLSYGLVGAAPAGLVMAADGSWSFDPSAAAYQHLAAGATQDVVATWRATDELGASGDSTLTIRVTGVNDAAVIGGQDAGEAIEDGALTVAGRLTVADADDGEASFQPATVQTALGALTLGADGAWSYVADAARANTMAEGDTAL